MDAELKPGTLIGGRYRLERLVGRGGMGEVWAALDATTNLRVALKVLLAAFNHQPRARKRFLAEARLTSAIEHPAVVPLREVLELDDETPVMVMDLLTGETLAQLLRRRSSLSSHEALAILSPVAAALAAAHEQGIVHRDVKPANIYLVRTREGATEPRVLDFGLAKLLDRERAGSLVTKAGMRLGTLGYMAPEQAAADPEIDHRADIWSLGVVTYECLTGVRPVEARNVGELLRRLVQDAITPIAILAPNTPAELARLVEHMLSPDAEDRPVDMAEIRDAFAAVLQRAPRPSEGAPA